MSMHGLQTQPVHQYDWVQWSITLTCYCHLVTGKGKTWGEGKLDSLFRDITFTVKDRSVLDSL